MTCKLGRIKSKPDPRNRTLMLARYLSPDLPAPPLTADWFTGRGAPWPLYRNDELGDCTCAAAGHAICNWREDAAKPNDPTDDQIILAYSTVSDYNPVTGDGDNGAEEIDVLKLWRQPPGIAGEQIGAFAAVDPGNVAHVAQTIAWFGCAYLGMELPNTAQGQEVWDVASWWRWADRMAGSWGGHAVTAGAYQLTPDGKAFDWVDVITWGARKRMTGAFFARYCDECWAIISPDWLRPDATTPASLNMTALQADLAHIDMHNRS